MHTFQMLAPLVTDAGELLGCALALASITYLILAIRQVGHFREQRRPWSSFRPPVTIMAPVYGSPPGLYECLRSLFLQDYPQFQIVFGLHSPDDPGRAVIERLRAEFPAVDTAVVIDKARIGSNPKVCNLANMQRAVKHDAIVMVDSDVKVCPRFLQVITEPLHDGEIGGVTCLYKAEATAGLASRLGALYINDWIIPSALVDVSMRDMDHCYGAAIAVTRQSLQAIGGFRALADSVGEDDELGERLHRAGFKVRLSRYVVTTLSTERTLRELVQHELRWIRSVRAWSPRDHALSVVMHAFAPVAVLTALAPSAVGITLLAVMLTLRVILYYRVRARTAISAPATLWLLPLREALNFLLWVASFNSWRMDWGTHSLEALGGRRMALQDDAVGAASKS